MSTIQDAINQYISKNKAVSPYDIVNDVLPTFYPLNDPESKISFELVLDAAKYFTTIIKCSEICVEQSMLYKYKVLSLQKNKYGDYVEQQTDVKKMLSQCKSLINDIDYKSRNISGLNKVGTQPKQYIMTPKSFFMCLVRSKNSSIYAEYYFHVLEIYNYYEEYFTKMYKEKIDTLSEVNKDLQESNIILDSDNMEKEETIIELNVEKSDLIRRIDQMQMQLQNQIQEMQAQNQTQLNKLQSTLDKIQCKLPSCVNDPPKESLNDQFIVMQKNDDNDYYVIRRQKRSITSVIKRKEADGYSIIYGIYNKEFVPNSVHLWNSTKEVLEKDKQIYFNDKTKNNLVLNISKEEFISIIKEIFDSRKLY